MLEAWKALTLIKFLSKIFTLLSFTYIDNINWIKCVDKEGDFVDVPTYSCRSTISIMVIIIENWICDQSWSLWGCFILNCPR